MSESTMTPPVGGGTPKVSKVSEAVIRFAGNSQDGIQSIGGFLARLAGRSEQEVMTFMTIPSTISGGPSIFQVRIGSGEVLSAGDEADVRAALFKQLVPRVPVAAPSPLQERGHGRIVAVVGERLGH